MSSSKPKNNQASASDVIFIIMLMTIFASELMITQFLHSFFSAIGLFYASLLDGSILALLLAIPLWFFVVQPLSVGTKYPALLFPGLLTGLFMTEFLVMISLKLIIPEADPQTITLSDACVTTLLIAPLLWKLTSGREKNPEQIHSDDILTRPLRLFVLLVFMVFLADLLMDIIYPNLFRAISPVTYLFVDASLSTLFIAALLWWILILPLKQKSAARNTVLHAVYTQAVDAIITIDTNETIESFNPAAEKLFGYNADELIGMKAELLFESDLKQLDNLTRSVTGNNTDGYAISCETTGRHRDGSLLTVDVSISRIKLDGQQKQMLILRDVSDRKKMEETIRVSEERLSFAIDGSNDGIWDWDLQTGEVYYCPRFKALLGYQIDEMENTFASFENSLHPDDHSRIIEAFRLHQKENIPFDVQFRLRSKTGSYHWYRAKGQVIREGSGKPLRMAGSISDINVQKMALEALRESEVRFRQIFEQSEDAIIFFKPGTCFIIDINETAVKLFGHTKTELLATGVELIANRADSPLLVNAISNITQERGMFLEKIGCICGDGREIIVSVRGKVMTLQNVNIIYTTFRDVTERLQMEQQSREIQAKLIQANKMTSLGLLVSGVAHEINNPNNYIMANTRLLESSWNDALKILREYYLENGEFFLGGVPFSELEDHSPRLFDGIRDGSSRIDSIITNLKNFARNDTSLENSTLDINQVATSAIAILHFELKKFTNNFHVELTKTIPRVKGSGQQLGQIIINLLMNACQSLPDREHGIWLATGINAETNLAFLSVRDEGHGMSPEKSRKIMEPFFTTKLDCGGTGLGLSICQSIANDHSWAIDFTSEKDKGSTFTVKIPLHADRSILHE